MYLCISVWTCFPGLFLLLWQGKDHTATCHNRMQYCTTPSEQQKEASWLQRPLGYLTQHRATQTPPVFGLRSKLRHGSRSLMPCIRKAGSSFVRYGMSGGSLITVCLLSITVSFQFLLVTLFCTIIWPFSTLTKTFWIYYHFNHLRYQSENTLHFLLFRHIISIVGT